ncbi:MAG: dockerin type I domain-containing protein [Clostridiales bacterium]|nr:dockerin type I domain-containing protein [Clostridiales bacterium]
MNGEKHTRKIVSVALALAMVLMLVATPSGIAYADGPDGNGAVSSLERFRALFYEDAAEANALASESQELDRVYLDRSAGKHWERTYDEPEPETTPDGGLFTASAMAETPSGPFVVGEERYFRAYLSSGYRAIKAVLASQGEHVNVWVLDDADWHATRGNTHSDATCKIRELMAQPKVLQEIAITGDAIYERMTDPVTGIAPHAGILNYASNGRTAYGDQGLDGHVNMLLSDTSGYWGYFESADNQTNSLRDSSGNTITTQPIDVIHVDISPNTGWDALMELSNKGDSLLFYGTFAHEFQHLLSQMHVWVYGGPTSLYWIDEALSGLVDQYYVQEGAEVIYAPYIEGATRNIYSGTRADFFTATYDNKAYGIGYLHSTMMHKMTNGEYGSRLYDFLMNVGATPEAKRAYYSNSFSMPNALGAAYKHVFEGKYDAFTDREVFDNLYYLFMENFAADGGVVVSQEGVPHTALKFHIPVKDTDNLWVTRYYDPTFTRIPLLAPGGAVALNGFQSNALAAPGRITLGASHEMLYRIGAAPDAGNTVLNISIPNVPGLECYVAIPNDTLGWARPASTSSPLWRESVFLTGATLYHVKKGQPNAIDTNGGYAYLFASTLFQDVNTTAALTWEPPAPGVLTGAASIDKHTPRYGDTVTALVKNGNAESLMYQWFVDSKAVGAPDADNTYFVTAGDIGKAVSVQITSADKTGELYAATVPVMKALYKGGDAVAPRAAYKTSTSIQLALVDAYEYSSGGSLWQDSPVFAGLLPDTTYDFYQRVKATATHDASAPSPVLKAATLDPSKVYASLRVDEESGIERDVVYTLSVQQAADLLNVELEFEIDGDLLAGKWISGLAGFNPLSDVFWVYAGGNKWRGTATLGLPSGSTTGLTSAAAVDVAEFLFAPKGIGDAAMALTGFRAVGLGDDTTVYLDALILDGVAVTNIDQRVFSKYDLNRDNAVDALDLGIMLLYCGFSQASPEWGTLVKVSDSRGKPVTASMCDVNCDGIIDMLDLLDLFIHYTK